MSLVSHAQARALDGNFHASESVYGWMVTYDHLEHQRTEIFGPHNITPAQQEALRAAAKAGHTHPEKIPEGARWFKMYDGDGEINYTGVFVGDDNEEREFAPLEDWGTPNVGSVRIDYLDPRTGKWDEL